MFHRHDKYIKDSFAFCRCGKQIGPIEVKQEFFVEFYDEATELWYTAKVRGTKTLYPK